MRNLKIVLFALMLVAVAFVGFALYRDGQATVDHGAADGPLALTGSTVERGRYLVAAADCVACHTAPGGAELAGGVAFQLPFGTLYSANLTPDPDTGIGAWSDDEFVAAVRSGLGRGGRHLYPAHPYTTYAGMARNDVLAIRAYLASLAPVRSEVPAAALSFPYSQRGLLPLWNALYQPAVGYQADAGHDAEWNRGAYLANALGHCGECHTPRNFAYALRQGAALSGAVTRGWKAYDITASALAGWSDEALEAYLATGQAPHHGVATGPMKAVVAFDTALLTAADRHALVRYLRGDALPAEAAAVPAPKDVADPTSTGANLYAGACAGCHGTAPGSTAALVDLAGSSTVRDPEGTNLLRMLAEGSTHGAESPISMPAFAPGYSAAERAAIANHVLARWGGYAPKLTATDATAAGTP